MNGDGDIYTKDLDKKVLQLCLVNNGIGPYLQLYSLNNWIFGLYFQLDYLDKWDLDHQGT